MELHAEDVVSLDRAHDWPAVVADRTCVRTQRVCEAVAVYEVERASVRHALKDSRFSGDVNNIVSAHRYKVYSPPEELLNLIVNGTVRETNRFGIGRLRFTECELPFVRPAPEPEIEVLVSTDDFKGFRTAMFGKTRMGKSNVVKIIAQSILEIEL